MLILKLLRTNNDRMLTVLRIGLGVVMFAHGAQKALGWFGGLGLQHALEFFEQKLGIPAPLALLAIAAELLGGAGLLLGALSRVAALGIAVNMAVAALLVHLPNGFFMNWFGVQRGEGIEYHLLAFAMAAMIVIRGSGAWSFDRLFFDWYNTRSTGNRDAAAAIPAGAKSALSRMNAQYLMSCMWIVTQYRKRL